MRCSSICWNIFAIIVALIAVLILHFGLRITAPDGPVESQLVWPASFLPTFNPSLERLSYRHLPSPRAALADVTAILLNWSRLSNVFGIVSVLCTPALDGTLSSIVVWNNNPERPLAEVEFAQCTHKVKVVNSPENVYFRARFEACAAASTTFCFIQDDDYLVLPEVIYTLRARASESSASGIFLAPPHEVLSSMLMRVVAEPHIHASFSWLGYGSIIRRTEARDFLDLMKTLNVTDEEFKMADNYFSILRNTFTETWFDQGIELGGGEPFTVGEEGNERNRKHIQRATELLDSVLLCDRPPCIPHEIPFVNMEKPTPSSVSKAPCVGTSCLFETSVRLLPEELDEKTTSAQNLLDVHARNSLLVDEAARDNFVNHPPSHAVDGDPQTSFCYSSGQFHEVAMVFFAELVDAISVTRKGEFVSLTSFGARPLWTRIEFAMLVSPSMEAIIRDSTFESLDGAVFVSFVPSLLSL
ncbi:hypothetical protein VNI00_002174 [Paramarasmius palmivorus]|uniref:Uncharacterized protein n=1 Tax=Paramarasmius palmivorus TaxID=297713 RepID=A0AAW0E115_9AGAR